LTGLHPSPASQVRTSLEPNVTQDVTFAVPKGLRTHPGNWAVLNGGLPELAAFPEEPPDLLVLPLRPTGGRYADRPERPGGSAPADSGSGSGAGSAPAQETGERGELPAAAGAAVTGVLEILRGWLADDRFAGT